VHADVEARVRDRGGEREERRRCARYEIREHHRAGERGCGVAGGKRVTVRDRHERIRLRRPVLSDGCFDEGREPVRSEHGEPDEDERERTAPHDAEREAEREPDEPVRADLRQRHEDLVQWMPAMLDDPPLEMAIPARQRAYY
jgi:hypothetical protein